MLPSSADAVLRSLCEGYKIDSSEIIRFNVNEKKLICGDHNAESWNKIPRSQAKYFARNFLQERGYLDPEFKEEGENVIIVVGEKTRITDVSIKGAPPRTLRAWQKRGIRGAPLDPKSLDSLERWGVSGLKSKGFACPRVSALGDASSGGVELEVNPGPRLNIASLEQSPVEGLMDGALERFNAFHVGDPYDYRNIALTSRRISQSGILQSSYFLTECADDGVHLTQKSISGASRLVSAGLGGSTEEYLIGKASWKQGRLGKAGSSFEVAGRASYRRQRFLVKGMVYPFSFPTRWHFTPAFSTRREKESRYEYLANDLLIPAAVNWDTREIGWNLFFGPRLNYTRVFSGADKGWTHFLSGIAGLEIISHVYELNVADPKSGYTVRGLAEFNSDKAFSTISAQKFTLSGEALYNFAGFDSPLLILSIRGFAGTTLVDSGNAQFSKMPPWLFYYFGGSADLRGFRLKKLPDANRGALTALYSGVEARLANIFPLNLQPIAFADFGVMGQKSVSLNLPVYCSPGIGIRWPSLIGVLRFTAAKGLFLKNSTPPKQAPSRWHFIFSIGEEF